MPGGRAAVGGQGGGAVKATCQWSGDAGQNLLLPVRPSSIIDGFRDALSAVSFVDEALPAVAKPACNPL